MDTFRQFWRVASSFFCSFGSNLSKGYNLWFFPKSSSNTMSLHKKNQFSHAHWDYYLQLTNLGQFKKNEKKIGKTPDVIHIYIKIHAMSVYMSFF